MVSPRLPALLKYAGSFAASAILFGALTACSSSPQSFTPAGVAANPATNESFSQGSATELWRRALARNPLPGAGCFQTSYPSSEWKRVACSTPPHLLYPLPKSRLAEQALAQNVGDGADFTADTKPHRISTSIGEFPRVTGVKRVESVTNPIFGCCGLNGPNSYSLQLNSYFFSTAACGNIQRCVGWEQFIFENPPGASKGALFIQDWLIPTGSRGLGGCPIGKGWEYADGGCVRNSPFGVNIPNVSITKLGKLTEIGKASSSGDSIYLSVGDTEYGMKNIQGDGITDLSAHWDGAEFNVIGNGGGDIAVFNKGSTITVSLETKTGLRTAPACPAKSGTTGESNNLKFIAAPAKPPAAPYPSIAFTMTNADRGGKPSCDEVRGT
ncbi:MAG: hypothetical protein WAL67_07230 [Candidatus Cybelea sp.]